MEGFLNLNGHEFRMQDPEIIAFMLALTDSGLREEAAAEWFRVRLG